MAMIERKTLGEDPIVKSRFYGRIKKFKLTEEELKTLLPEDFEDTPAEKLFYSDAAVARSNRLAHGQIYKSNGISR